MTTSPFVLSAIYSHEFAQRMENKKGKKEKKSLHKVFDLPAAAVQQQHSFISALPN